MADVHSKNKWSSQRIQKKFKNRHQSRYPKPQRYSTNSIRPYRSLSGWRQRYKENMYFDRKLCCDIKQRENNSYIDINDDLLSIKHNVIPNWICSRCTYCNIERELHCKICNFRYDKKLDCHRTDSYNQTVDIGNNDNRYHQIVLNDFIENEQEDDDDELVSIAIELSLKEHRMKTTRKYSVKTKNKNAAQTFKQYWNEMSEYMFDLKKIAKINHKNEQKMAAKRRPFVKESSLLKQLDIAVTLKLFPSSTHRLLQCSINVLNDYSSLIPCYINMDNQYEIASNIEIPVQYDTDNECRKWCHIHKGIECKNIENNNCELMTIAQYVWRSKYPQYFDKNPIWRLNDIHHQQSNLPIRYNLYDVMINFIPSMDILSSILFMFLGYDKIDVIKINGIVHIPMNDEMEQQTQTPQNKVIFMNENNNNLPFVLFDSNLHFTEPKAKRKKTSFNLK